MSEPCPICGVDGGFHDQLEHQGEIPAASLLEPGWKNVEHAKIQQEQCDREARQKIRMNAITGESDALTAASAALWGVTTRDATELAAIALAAATPLIQRDLLKKIEAKDSPLCDCDKFDGQSIADDGTVMDHDCECSAVMTAAAVLGSAKLTQHHLMCGCGDIYDREEVFDER